MAELLARGWTAARNRYLGVAASTPLYHRQVAAFAENTVPGMWLNPNAIDDSLLARMREPIRSNPGVKAGRWDKMTMAFQDRLQVHSIRSHFRDEKPWEETDYYQRISSVITTEGSWRHCTTDEDLRRFLRGIDDLYRSIDSNGYQRQDELPDAKRSRFEKIGSSKNHEIGVLIDRDGSPIWFTQGQHRLAVSQLLDVDEVFVRVHGIHVKSPVGFEEVDRKIPASLTYS